MSRTLTEAFFRHVDQTGPHWMWTGHVTRSGYGRLKRHYKELGAHRVSYEIHYGPVPERLFVLHRCHIRSCVNPGHLYAGTTNDNMRDMVEAHRQAAGERHHHARLTDEQVAEIRAKRELGTSYAALAKLFRVTPHYIWMLCHYQRRAGYKPRPKGGW